MDSYKRKITEYNDNISFIASKTCLIGQNRGINNYSLNFNITFH